MGDFVIGQKAAIYQSHFSGGAVTLTTVERDTKLYWIAGGRKFRKKDGLEPNSTERWGRGRYLLPTDDSRVVTAITDGKKWAAFARVHDAANDLASDRENLNKLEALSEAVDAYRKILT